MSDVHEDCHASSISSCNVNLLGSCFKIITAITCLGLVAVEMPHVLEASMKELEDKFELPCPIDKKTGKFACKPQMERHLNDREVSIKEGK